MVSRCLKETGSAFALVLGNKNLRKEKKIKCSVPSNKSECSSPAFPTNFEWTRVGQWKDRAATWVVLKKIIIHFEWFGRIFLNKLFSAAYAGNLDPASTAVVKTLSARSFL